MSVPMLAALLAAALPAAAAPEGPSIAVYDAQPAGGQSASVRGLIAGMEKEGYRVRRITDLSAVTLAPHDVLYLSDMHHPGNVPEGWKESIRAYVDAGGSVLQTWHHHILGEVGVGVRRVYGKRQMRVVPGHPAVEGITDFESRFKDHIVESVGKGAVALLKNDAGDVVAVAGTLGKGKVISTGLALAIPDGNNTAAPRGPEKALLAGFVKWLTPETAAAERIAVLLPRPTLAVTPRETLVPEGMAAPFDVRVAARADEVRVTCAGARIAPTGEPLGLPGGMQVRDYRVEIPAPPAKGAPAEHEIAVAAGEARLSEKVKVTSIAAPAPPKERRGVWLHVGEDRHPKDVMPELKRLGINMAVPRIAGGTAAFYASKVQPDILDPLAPDGDWLAETVKHARANGIETHPYVNNCIVEGRCKPETLAKLRAEGRLQVGAEGQPINWFCPSQEANLAAIEAPMIELATRYEVDGVQYDFIRYSNASGCFCDKCRALFEQETGKPVAAWPADAITGDRHAEWVEFRCRRISAIVERVSARIRREAPKVKISAAVFSEWPACRESVGQDWVTWCQRGWLDFVCPMTYTLRPELFAERSKVHREALPAGFPLVEGIGIAAGPGRMAAPRELALQIALARQAGAAGFVGFAYQPEHTSTLFGPLRQWLARR